MKNYLMIVIMLMAIGGANAQVKIGSNPTTIDANRNLEVEATNGQKVYITMDDGLFFIENTPAAAETDSILMTNAATGQVNKMSIDRLANMVNSSGIGGAGGECVECIVPDLSLSYQASIVDVTIGSTTYKVLDLSGMAPGECFWDWPFGTYAVRLPTTVFRSITVSTFCPKTSHRELLAGAYLSNASNTASGPQYATGIPSVGWHQVAIVCAVSN